jgi:hypothetical protein
MKSCKAAVAPVVAVLLICGLCLVIPQAPAAADDKKMKPEELIAHHLEAIGSPEARAAATSRVASGRVNVVNRVGNAGSISGQAMLVSSGAKVRFGMNFPAPDYSGEDLAFDGKKVMTGFLSQGRRSALSMFLNAQEVMLKEGLVGGVLSTAWPLLRVEQLQPRLDYRGLKKIDGQQLHELSYRGNKGKADLRIMLYFDQAAFRHLRTEYSFEIGAPPGNGPNESGRQQESRFKVIETFDDFRQVDGLTLPHKYKLQLSAETMRGSMLSDWMLDVTRISHKEKFEEEIFTIR